MRVEVLSENGGEKRNVLIVSALLPKTIHLAPLQHAEARRCPASVSSAHFARVGCYSHSCHGDAEVEDQAPAARLVP
jgi:hypothetical protein